MDQVTMSNYSPNEKCQDILFTHNLDKVTNLTFADYAIHVLCKEGTFSFKMMDKIFHVKKDDLVIWTAPQLISDIHISRDIRVSVLYTSYQFARNNMPNNDYDLVGTLSLLENPVLSLTTKEVAVCESDLQIIEKRLGDKYHHFYAELIGCFVVAFYLDLYEIHVRINDRQPISDQNALLIRRFINLLSTEEYKNTRGVAHYADMLYVTPKYLSEVCKKVSGRTPIFWIDRFAITEITRLLKNKELTLTEISDRMNFSSTSYFSRYVQRILGVSPTEYRQRL